MHSSMFCAVGFLNVWVSTVREVVDRIVLWIVLERRGRWCFCEGRWDLVRAMW